MTRWISLVVCFALSTGSVPALAASDGLESALGARPWLEAGASGQWAPDPDDERIARSTDQAEPGEDEASDVERRIAELEAERDSIDVGRPRFWTITGAAMTGAGVAVGIVSIVACLGSSEAGAGCSPEHWAGFGTTATVFTIAGMATLIPNQRKLQERNERRRQLGEEIRNLRDRGEEAGRSRLRVGFDPRSNVLSLGWVY